MSALLVAALKVGFLILLWVVILFMARIIQTDLRATNPDPVETPLGRTPRQARGTNGAARGTKGAGRGAKKGKTPTTLSIVEGRQAGLGVPLANPITIGRDPGCVLILDDDYVSTRHCTLGPDGNGGFYVEDHGSTNGTYINGVRITMPTALGMPDELRIGNTVMRLVP